MEDTRRDGDAQDGALDVGSEVASADAEVDGDGETHSSESDDFGHQIAEVWDEFMTIAIQADPHLYDPGRHEVLSGLAAHALRLTLAVAAHPGLWIGEFSAPLLRSVAEILIDLAWFSTDEGRNPEAHRTASAAATAQPRTSRSPRSLAAIATRNAAFTMRPPSPTFSLQPRGGRYHRHVPRWRPG